MLSKWKLLTMPLLQQETRYFWNHSTKFIVADFILATDGSLLSILSTVVSSNYYRADASAAEKMSQKCVYLSSYDISLYNQWVAGI